MGRARALCLPVVLALASVAAAGPAHAVTTSGSDLENAPNTAVCAIASCSLAQQTLPPASQAPGGARAGVSGILVRWRVSRAAGPGSGAQRVRLRTTGPTGESQADVEHWLPATAGVHVFPVTTRLRVEAGDLLGVDLLDTAGEGLPIVHSAPAAGSFLSWSPALDYGESREPDGAGDGEILLNADIEPDADGDGAGDETQDACPTDPAIQVPCRFPPPLPPRAPSLVDPSLLHAVFRAGPVQPRAARRRAPRGTAFRFRLDRDSAVTIAIQRRASGRRSGGACRRPAPANRRGRKCLRLVGVGAIRNSGRQGRNSFLFSGRLRIRGRARALPPARYRAVLQATDAFGSSQAKRLHFRVVK